MTTKSAGRLVAVLAVVLCAGGAFSGEEQTPATYGWRGNWTGLYPEAAPPTAWRRLPKGVTAGMACQAEKPADLNKNTGKPLSKGLPTEWLSIGPFEVADVSANFDKEQLAGEANLSPNEGEKAGELEWKRLKVNPGDGVSYEQLNLIPNAKPNQIAYAHTYLWSEKDGQAEIVAEHVVGLKVWVNGKEFYKSLSSVMSVGSMYGFSACKRDYTNPAAAVFTVDVKKGWNRFLVKQGTKSMANEWLGLVLALRLADSPREYDEQNIRWITRLPERTNASPLIVGDKIFTAAEPDELYCLDKKTGKILWRRTNTFFDAIPPEEVKANAVLRDQVAPLAEELNKTQDLTKNMGLRNKMMQLLGEVDKTRFVIKWDGHMSGHFGIVGFSTQPVCDGKRIAVFAGNGVIACYDLAGNRKWIKQIPIDMYCYTSSPAIADNKLIINCPGLGTIDKTGHAHSWLYAFDLETGKDAWINKEAWGGCATLIPAKLKGTAVIVTQKGDLLRAADGHILFSNPHKIPNDTGWAPAVVTGDTICLPWSSFGLYLWDFSGVSGDTWTPKESYIGGIVDNKTPDGKWVDRYTAAAPLIYNDVAYCIDIFGIFYAVDLKQQKLLYREQLKFEPYDNYCHLGVSASPTLGGKNIYVMDNQGVCFVLEPGPQLKIVARNVIATARERDRWPLPREVLTNGSPVFDGKCLYVRGHENLYCLGEK